MKQQIKTLLPAALQTRIRSLLARGAARQEFRAWQAGGYRIPMPGAVKRRVLVANTLPDATWIETGTYRGDTTAILAQHARQVVSLEPEPGLFGLARQRFAGSGNVRIVNGASEDVFPDLLPDISGNVCFWLDGHFSDGGTYLGKKACPVEDELAAIEANLPHFDRVNILIDDLRMFGTDPAYPPADYLVDWARRTGFGWGVEHDIFIMRR